MTYPKGRTGHGSALRGVRAAVCVAVALTGAAVGCARPGNTPAGTPETSVTVFASAAPVSPGQASLRAEIAPAPAGTCGTAGGVARAPAAVPAKPLPAQPNSAERNGAQPNSAERNGAQPNSAERNGAPPNRAPSFAAPRTAPPAAAPRAAATAAAPPPAHAPATAASPPDGAEPAEERARRALEAQRQAIPRRGNVPADAAARAADCISILRMELVLRRASGTLDENTVRAALTAAHLTRVVVGPGLRFAGSTGQACVVGSVPAGSGSGAQGDAGNPEFAITPLGPDGTCRP